MSVWTLWLPILLSGLATHFMSVIAWMLLPHHKPEWKPLRSGDGADCEDDMQDWLEAKGVAADQYLFPFMPEGGKPDEGFKQKMEGKCRGMLVLWPTPPNMGAAIGKTLAFFLVAAAAIGYLTSLALPAGAPFGEVFRFVAIAALLTHCFGLFPGVFWFRRKVAMDLFDKVAYAVVTGLIYALLWPSAPVN